MCTLQNRGNLFILTLTGESTGDDEHLLSPARVSLIRAALAEVKSQAVDGSALVTLAPGRFFSNGAKPTTGRAMLRTLEQLRALAADLMALPMPTIAAVTGHAAGSGLLFAMLHDYVIMTSSKGVIYLSELDMGISLPDYATALLRAKVGSASARRDLVLRAVKVKGEAAAGMGVVDRVYDSEEEVVAAAMHLGEELGKKGWCGKAYEDNRKVLYPEVCGLLGLKHEILLPSRL